MSAAGAAEPLRLHIREKRFPAVADAPENLVIEGLHLDVPAGEFVALLGPSGCGKTTMLNILAGLDTDFDGEVVLPPGARIGYVFQEPRLLPWRTVEENIRLVLDDDGHSELIDDLLAETGLAEARDTYPPRLSLGMARRAAIARAFAIRPTLLLMDEPFVSLDEPRARRLRALLLEVLRHHPATVIFVTHNLREAIVLADRIVVMAPPPTHVVAEVRVPLSAEERRDEAAIERLRVDLLERQAPAFADLG